MLTIRTSHCTLQDPRVNLVMSTLAVTIQAGRMEATTTGVTSVAYAPAPNAGEC